MARTKQTARVSTGGKAPRAPLKNGSSKRRKQPLRKASTKRLKTTEVEIEPEPEEERAEDAAPEDVPTCTTWRMPKEKEPTGPINYTETSDTFCYVCHNGGDLIACDECRRVMCLWHAPKIEALPKAILEDLHFRCPSCHTLKTRGDAKQVEEEANNKQPTPPYKKQPTVPQGKEPTPAKGKQLPKGRPAAPYYGLYYPASERPYFSKWVELKMTSSRPQHSQVDTSPVVILNVRLATLREKSSPARLVHHLLTPWFDGPAREYLHIDLPFNVTKKSMAANFRSRLTNARIVLFIYSHSHDESGDLYYGDNYSSPSVGMWWQDMITPKLAEIATTGNNELCIGMLACGALIMHDTSRTELMTAIKRINAKHTFGFSTKELQPSLTTLFFYNFVPRVLIEGSPLTQLNIATLLDQAVFLARHTPLFHFYFYWELVPKRPFAEPPKELLTVVEYKWTHDTMRPDGNDIGLQCPGCGSLASRVGKKVNSKHDRRVVVWCKMTDCKWEETYTVSQEVRDLKTGENGLWTARPFDG
ncbi:hypothetical protein LXA43DRAFT_1091789 [Ganoderma leucocontextum]|nr:hypothetical protein LXA43DRAFT_1097392 [Ganoderma leucocontextum]KAI1794740.1 hypothetical protein LXA43DRAFT_1091789 [Ganoderma leucocontextum]